MSDARRCCRCQEVKPLDEFHRRAGRPSGRDYKCKTCSTRKAKAYYNTHVEQHKNSHAKWYERNKQRYDAGEVSVVEEKLCQYCRQVKPRSEFTLARSSLDGLDWGCRACKAIRSAAYHRVRQQKDPHLYYKNIWTLRRLRREDFDQMLIEQSGRCALCSAPMKKPHLDHCHESGRIRGLLCQDCNVSLGWIEKLDRAGVTRDMIDAYLSGPDQRSGLTLVKS